MMAAAQCNSENSEGRTQENVERSTLKVERASAGAELWRLLERYEVSLQALHSPCHPLYEAAHRALLHAAAAVDGGGWPSEVAAAALRELFCAANR